MYIATWFIPLFITDQLGFYICYFIIISAREKKYFYHLYRVQTWRILFSLNIEQKGKIRSLTRFSSYIHFLYQVKINLQIYWGEGRGGWWRMGGVFGVLIYVCVYIYTYISWGVSEWWSSVCPDDVLSDDMVVSWYPQLWILSNK